MQHPQFDDLTANPVSALSTVGVYHGLNYSEFNLAKLDQTTGAAVEPSKPNVIAFELENGLDAGQVGLNPVASVTTASGTKYFDLLSFFFSCSLDQAQSAVTTNEGCDISVTGYNAAGKMVGEGSFNYAPTSLVNPPFVKAVLPSTFVGLVNVTFAVSTATVATSLTAVGLDNITHINYS